MSAAKACVFLLTSAVNSEGFTPWNELAYEKGESPSGNSASTIEG